MCFIYQETDCILSSVRLDGILDSFLIIKKEKNPEWGEDWKEQKWKVNGLQ